MRPFGIYIVTNQVTGKWYVGKTGNTVWDRWTDHKSNARRNAKGYLYRSMRKYGEDQFLVDTVAEVTTEEEANNLERIWILLLRSHEEKFGYNLTLGGDGVRMNEATKKVISRVNKGRKHTPEFCARMSLIVRGRRHTEETKKKMSLVQTGRVTSEETKKKQSEARIGRFGGENHPMFGRKHSPETRKRLSEVNIGKPSWNKGVECRPETKEKLRAVNTKRYDDNPDLKQTLSTASKTLWTDPAYRVKMKAAQDIRYARERAERLRKKEEQC